MIYISLLRGINVGGRNKIKMADLKEVYKALAYEEVITYIQSGNVIFKTKKTAEAKLEKSIKEAIKKTFGLEIPVLVISKKELEALAQANPYKDRKLEPKYIHFTILASPPDQEKIDLVNAIEFPGEEFTVTDRVAYLCLPNGYGRTKLHNNFFESKLKVKATSRNLKSILKLIELSDYS